MASVTTTLPMSFHPKCKRPKKIILVRRNNPTNKLCHAYGDLNPRVGILQFAIHFLGQPGSSLKCRPEIGSVTFKKAEKQLFFRKGFIGRNVFCFRLLVIGFKRPPCVWAMDEDHSSVAPPRRRALIRLAGLLCWDSVQKVLHTIQLVLPK